MRTRPWIIAAPPLLCLLLASAAPPLASEMTPSWRSPELAKAMQTAKDAAVVSGRQNDQTDPGSPSEQPPAFVLDSQSALGILGNAVRSAVDEDMGRIVDVIVDRTGTTRAVIIDFGGFLGVGSRKLAIDWNAMRFSSLKGITLDLTRDQVKAAPQYEAGKPIIVLSASAEFARSRVTERMP